MQRLVRSADFPLIRALHIVPAGFVQARPFDRSSCLDNISKTLNEHSGHGEVDRIQLIVTKPTPVHDVPP